MSEGNEEKEKEETVRKEDIREEVILNFFCPERNSLFSEKTPPFFYYFVRARNFCCFGLFTTIWAKELHVGFLVAIIYTTNKTARTLC